MANLEHNAISLLLEVIEMHEKGRSISTMAEALGINAVELVEGINMVVGIMMVIT